MASTTIEPQAPGEQPHHGGDPGGVTESFAGFSVFGGPLHALLARLKLARGSNVTPAGFALGIALWSVLVALAALEGQLPRIFSLDVIAGHVRLLIVIPMLFMCASSAAPRMAAFARYLILSGVVRGQAVGELVRHVTTVKRLRDSFVPDVVCLALTLGLAITYTPLPLFSGATDGYDPARAAAPTLLGRWYWFVCLPVFRYLILRWLWALLLWVYFLLRLSRLALKLIPTHPDRAGGLGYLGVVHAEFSFLVFGMSCVLAANFAEDVLAGLMTLNMLYSRLCFLLIGNFVLFVGPLFLFSRKLWEALAEGTTRYMELAARYVDEFDCKWIGEGVRHRGELLGTPDLQTLADLGSSVEVVDNMSLIPASRRLLLSLAVAALAPMIPIALMLLPGDDIAAKLIKFLLGSADSATTQLSVCLAFACLSDRAAGARYGLRAARREKA